MKKRIKKNIAVLVCLTVLALGMLAACSEAQPQMINSAAGLLGKIAEAGPGEVILVGDIDFSASPGISNEFVRISLQKSITIKSAYKDRNAVLYNAGFNIAGSKVPGEKLECSFVNITFDGGVDGKKLSSEDWDIPTKEDGTPGYDEPLLSQYAISFGGNVSAGFEGCVFRNYMYETGPVIRAYYGDYTGNPGLASMLADYSDCRLSVCLTKCEIKNNAAMLGGSIYLDGNDNISLRAENCAFSGNISGCGEFSEGGGACRLSDLDAVFIDCSFDGNVGNYCYLEKLEDLKAEYKAQYEEFDESDRTDYYYLADTDRTQGGAIYSQNGSLILSGCRFSNNRASLGGAVRLLNTNTLIRSCEFTGNCAVPEALDPYDEVGPWSAMGMGGAVYIESAPDSPVNIYSTDIVGNTAKNAYGSIYGFWTEEYKNVKPLGLGSIDLYGCTIKDNVCLTAYDYQNGTMIPWVSHPGDILNIEYLKLQGCVLADAVYEKDFPRNELPSEENGYNYISAAGKPGAEYKNAAEISVPGNVKAQWDKDLKALTGDRLKPEGVSKFPAEIAIPAVLVILAAAYLLIRAYRRKKGGLSPQTGLQAGCSGSPEAPESTDALASKALLGAGEIEALRENVKLKQLLTEREMDVMCEYISGSSRSGLAEKLMISESTAKTHISNIYSKLEVRSKAELVNKLKNI